MSILKTPLAFLIGMTWQIFCRISLRQSFVHAPTTSDFFYLIFNNCLQVALVCNQVFSKQSLALKNNHQKSSILTLKIRSHDDEEAERAARTEHQAGPRVHDI
jgi:hypothetical protein